MVFAVDIHDHGLTLGSLYLWEDAFTPPLHQMDNQPCCRRPGEPLYTFLRHLAHQATIITILY